jgi:signal transduction histidine kinase
MALFNNFKKRNTLRWFFLGIGIVAVLALTSLNIYSLYALRESTIEAAKDNKKNQLEEFTHQVRARFYSPFMAIRKLNMKHLEEGWEVSGAFPVQFKEVLTEAINDSLFTVIHYISRNVNGCHNPDQPIYKYHQESELFTVAIDVPREVCDGFGISKSRIQVMLDDYRWNNKVTFDAHRSMTLALINVENRTVVGHLNFIIDKEYLVDSYLKKEMREHFGPTQSSGLVVWLRDWMQNEILVGSDENYTWNRDVYEIDIRQRFPDLLENWILHASFLESPTVAASNASLTRNLIVLTFAVVALFGALVFMFINAQRERELAERQAGFLANITHELKTPLAVMQAAGENIADGRVTDGVRLRSYGDHIYQEAVRLRKMIEKLLDVAKVDAGENVVQHAPHQIDRIAERVFETNEKYITSKGFTFQFESDDSIPLAMVDPDHIETILNNLIENAVKYSSNEKFIHIGIRKQGNSIAMSVTDKGDGIPRKSHKLIFDKFYRVENSLTAKTKGHGLGLAIVKNLVEMNGATIIVKSELETGSTFTVVFPALTKESDSIEQQTVEMGAGRDQARPVSVSEYV